MSVSMAPDEYNKSAIDAATMLKQHLDKLFPEATVTAMVPENKGIMSNSLWVSVYNVAPSSSDLQRLNATMGCRFVMHLTNGGGKQVAMQKFEFECLSLPTGAKAKNIKYRKCSGLSPVEAAKNLVKWFDININALRSYG